MKKLLIALLCTTPLLNAQAQFPYVRFGLEAQAGYTSNDQVPFWMRSNQFGSVPLSGASASLIGSARVDYDTTKTKLVDWGASLQVRGNAGKGSNLTLIEGYGKLRAGIFQLQGGRIKEVMGLSDTLLTSGNYAISGNALGIPKVQISIPEYYPIPFLGRFVAFKGNFAHGWVGKTPVQYGDTNMTTTQFHQKSLYVRLGKPTARLKLYGGFNHQVFFGDEKYVWSERGNPWKPYDLSAWDTYQRVVLGRVWNSSKIGNHLGSVDFGADYRFNKIEVLLYHQFFYEVGGLAHLSNITDGLTGLSLRNKQPKSSGFRWNKVLVEFLFTRNQGGESWSKITPSGDEDYYNNYLYTEGWSYKKAGLGTPFITSRTLSRDGLPVYPPDYFINNRVVMIHLGAELGLGVWKLLTKLSYSQNYGTFGTHPNGHTTGTIHTPAVYGIFPKLSQFSGYAEVNRPIGKNTHLGFMGAWDQGKLLNNSGGLLVKVAKYF
ncbi:capsule assembly Wzi family protein [Dyadobacter jiangsuensis]|uniref:Capsule assembly protein Wzi n=1 Tax=Dyadobacter jiangsuensis TaxID=1591085 RepID=A0A2P8FSU8_9BACT|nr:capsule assembly Wzi family protein [Dyadobacter jiangsuensis]PSL24800.1 capsule assembly protein Wzi [Dyadobacter jiangsuensis]